MSFVVCCTALTVLVGWLSWSDATSMHSLQCVVRRCVPPRHILLSMHCRKMSKCWKILVRDCFSHTLYLSRSKRPWPLLKCSHTRVSPHSPSFSLVVGHFLQYFAYFFQAPRLMYLSHNAFCLLQSQNTQKTQSPQEQWRWTATTKRTLLCCRACLILGYVQRNGTEIEYLTAN